MAGEGTTHRNRLANESSPYLLQHAGNPVDWYPWGEEAFERARVEEKPILLSVGYSSCHWCHVMAHESFEDPAIAAEMNRNFVNIKVDREERPDVDGVYMTAVQAMMGQGGWPMTVFLTPDGKPFYAGTYFPPDDGFGRPGFRRVLEAVHEKWVTDRSALTASAAEIIGHLERGMRRPAEPGGPVSTTDTQQAVEQLRRAYDVEWGGFGQAPKFPSPSTLELLLACHAARPGAATGEPGALEMALHTLRCMASGGMYDQLAGGFARYSVDRYWLVPHFEKMLYDNAQLVRVYLHAWQITGEALFERVARETLAYLEREMLDEAGGFYSAQDADSEGIEGKYYLWTAEEVREAAGDEDYELACQWFGVDGEGNFSDPHHPELTGRHVLTARADGAKVAGGLGLSSEEISRRVERIRGQLLAVRSRRVPPGLDDKVLASWNGLMLAALSEAAWVLGDSHYRQMAERLAQFLWDEMYRDGRLLHSYRAGRASVDGMLEDYAYVGLGLVELYRATGELAWLKRADELFRTIVRRFHDDEQGGFFDTARDGERLVLRQKALFDAASPSGNGSAGLLAMWLARYHNRPEEERFADEVVGLVRGHLVDATAGFGTIWQTALFRGMAPREVVITGDERARVGLEQEVAKRYLPWVVVATTRDCSGLPLFEGRCVEQGARAYVCRAMTCEQPTSEAAELAAQLEGLPHEAMDS